MAPRRGGPRRPGGTRRPGARSRGTCRSDAQAGERRTTSPGRAGAAAVARPRSIDSAPRPAGDGAPQRRLDRGAASPIRIAALTWPRAGRASALEAPPLSRPPAIRTTGLGEAPPAPCGRRRRWCPWSRCRRRRRSVSGPARSGAAGPEGASTARSGGLAVTPTATASRAASDVLQVVRPRGEQGRRCRATGRAFRRDRRSMTAAVTHDAPGETGSAG